MDFATSRQNMIDSQLRPNRIHVPELVAQFNRVPREAFVDTGSTNLAYADADLPMGENRVMFKPLIAAQLIQALDLTEDDTLLVVAGGTGYSACVAAPLVSRVVMVEEDGYLLDIANRNILDLHLHNVELKRGKPEKGCKESGPYTKILIDAAVEEIPMDIIEQLKEGGKLATVLSTEKELMDVTIFTKIGKTMFADEIFETRAEVLKNFARQERFVF